jgi:ankyrin repeat protein
MCIRPLLFCLVLFSFRANAQDIFEASRSGNIQRIEELIGINPDTVNALNPQGFNALMIACYRGRTECAKYLLEHGAQVNQTSDEGSALQAACYQNNLELAKLLIQYGADLNNQGPDGNTALIYAVLNQNVKMVQWLVKKGADQSLKNNDNQTALTLAKTQPNKKIIHLLEDKKKK